MFKFLKSIKRFLKKINALGALLTRSNLKTSQIAQRQLFNQIKTMKSLNCLPKFNEVGFREYSQFDEDGILLYLFAIIGFTNKYCLDIAFASPYESNTTNLILNWAFGGTLVCGDSSERTNAETFFKTDENTWFSAPQLIQSWVTVENIHKTLEENSVPNEIDFFSLDVDGIDYWILQKVLEKISPRVITLEAHGIWKDLRSVVVPYKEDFNRYDIHEDYMGASIPAYIKLMKKNGYRLVAYNKYGFNLFFVKEELCGTYLPELAAQDSFKDLPDYYIKELDRRREAIENLEWIEV